MIANIPLHHLPSPPQQDLLPHILVPGRPLSMSRSETFHTRSQTYAQPVTTLFNLINLIISPRAHNLPANGRFEIV